MKKITVSVCCGTTCYLLGNYNLLSMKDKLPIHLADKVEIIGSPCLGMCTAPKNGRPPFVKIEDFVMASADFDKVVDYLDNLIKEG